MAASWDLLDERSENELHKSRLLNVEEKPFKRITKRLGFITKAVAAVADVAPDEPTQSSELLQEELTLDFAAFDSNVARFQFLHDANQRERERYQVSQQRILAECNAVRENNSQLREQLEEARQRLAKRKKFDELADKITSNRLLRPRQDQVINLAKLEDECRELERESETYSATWKERRAQFNRIMEEGMLLRRQIRDEKEEVDRREGMNEGGEDDGDADKESQTPRNTASERATPRLDGEGQLKPDGLGETPVPLSVAGTPVPDKTKDGSRLEPLADGYTGQRGLAQDVSASSDVVMEDGTREKGDADDGEQLSKEMDDQDDREDGEMLSAGDQQESNRDQMEVDG
ncbi:hypothetical protein CDD82_1067 [Ophiocordyceps australis]|uniref:Tho complex subunit 7/Mft1p n=1 Tax=Ophiocordyceps australis TaxID=1399860 RepID=A0A2C5YKN5_9HYPO|nr:hypothetical protein CDD82_1067 [Ophiocordyceps australis]